MKKPKKFSIVRELKKGGRGKPLSRKGKKKIEELFASGAEVMGDRPSCWPHTSRAAAVHPTQVGEANALLAKAGSRCHHDKSGKLISPSKAEFKKMLKVKGLRDFGAFN